MDSPYVLTANYGELRPNHFHAGLDFATGGLTDLPVYSVAEGYVSRVKVSSTGYGKCVYITHPNGKVSVYAHLNSYSIKIGDLVKKEQYTLESYEVEFFPKPFTVPVKKGEIIGLSGNTGNSTGPHLHFEIRDEKSEAPLNPLEHLRLPDYTRPVIQAIGLYSWSDSLAPKLYRSLKVIHNEEDILLVDNPLLETWESNIGIAFAGTDRFTPSGSQNNIYAVRLFFDGKLIYWHKLSGIKFDDTRYINEYSESQAGLKYQKCFLPQVYPREFIHRSVNRGRIQLPDTNFHNIKLVVSDEYGNENDVQFHIRTKKISAFLPPSLKSDLMVDCTKEFIYKKQGLLLRIPANSLFYPTPLIVENTLESTGKLIILPGDANLRSPATLSFRVPKLHLKNKQKLVLKNGQQFYAPTLRLDSAYYTVKALGWFQLTEDIQAPVIIALFKSKKSRKPITSGSLNFTITDAMSGISRYKLYLNNKWVLAEYDAKSDLLTYKFDEESPRGKINLRLEVEDKVGNRARYECQIKR